MRLHTAMAICSAAFLCACGGGGGDGNDGSNADGLFDDYASAQAGGYRSLSAEISDSTPSWGPSCGYTEIPTLKQVEAAIKSQGGSVSTSSDSQWCGSTSEETFCLTRVGGSLVTDELYSAAPGEHDYEVIIPGLPGAQRAYFLMYSSGSNGYASADIERPDTSIPSSGNCTNTTPTQVSTAINGTWTGVRVTYNSATKAGVESAATVTCSSQTCSFSTETFGQAGLADYQPVGVWRGEVSDRVIGAAMSADGKALAVYVCDKPLNEAQVIAHCAFYGLSR